MNKNIIISGSGNRVRVSVTTGHKRRRLILRICATLVLVVFMIFLFSNCNRPVSQESHYFKVQIDHVSSTPGYYQKVSVGNSSVNHWIPATYSTTVLYNSEKLSVDGYDSYRKCKDHVGEFILAEVVVTYYRDGSCSYKVVSI